MTLYEKCQTCKGTTITLVADHQPFLSTATKMGACPDCKDGYKEHDCPRDASCQCYTVGFTVGYFQGIESAQRIVREDIMSNLPPGVRESDIPGNRPEDLAYEQWTERHQTDKLAREIAEAMCCELGSGTIRILVPRIARALKDSPIWLADIAVDLDLIPAFDAEPDVPDKRGE